MWSLLLFQAEDGIRDGHVTGVQTCALPISSPVHGSRSSRYGYRTLNGRRAFHAGVDISTAGKRRSVYAAYAGTIERIVRGRKHGQPATSGQVLAPGRSPNGVIIRNPEDRKSTRLNSSHV